MYMTENSNTPICYVVVPCYNEEKAFPFSSEIFLTKLEQLIDQNRISAHSRVLFVDDGSKDKTWELICSLHHKNPLAGGLKLSANCGHQNALLAGLLYAKDKADITASFDADLQDDINVLDEFINKYEKGAQIVYGVRNDRSTDSFFKKSSARCFYKLMKILGIHLVYDHADCRLMSRKALQALAQYQEENLFLRGIVTQLGFKTDIAYYSRAKRVAGKEKYSLGKMLSFAWQGMTSFSMAPIHFISLLGLLMAGSSLLVFTYFLFGKIFGSPVPGYASLICSIWFIGGMELFAISVIGEYVGKTYLEAKRRPRYIIEEELN